MKVPKRPKSTIPLIGRFMRTTPVTAMLWPMEKLTEGKKVESDSSRVVTTDRLTPQLLHDFFTHKVLAIHLPRQFGTEVCDTLGDNILKAKLINWNVYDLKQDMKASDVNVLGEPFNMANKTEESWRRYFASALQIASNLGSLAAPCRHGSFSDIERAL